MKILKGLTFMAYVISISTFISCNSKKSETATETAGVGEDKSIELQTENINEYGTTMAFPTELAHKADTSTSIVVDWRQKADVSVSNITAEEQAGVVYKTGIYTDGKHKGEPLELHMDIMFHSTGEAQPVIVFIPGGGFTACDSEGSLRLLRQYLAENGYAVASIEYHVVGSGLYSDAVSDIHDAIAYLKENAATYNIDPEKIALMGNSAGGYMTALYAAMDSSELKASIDLYGLSDLTRVAMDYSEDFMKQHHLPTSSESQFVNGVYSGIGIADEGSAAQKANPLAYIDGNECPMLIMHGDADLIVSPSQSLLVHEALKKQGVSSTRYSLVGAGHGFGGFNSEDAVSVILNFLSENLK